MIRTATHTLYGDWRAGAYGANRRAHLWTAGRAPACGRRLAYATTAAARRRDVSDLCYDCLAYTGRDVTRDAARCAACAAPLYGTVRVHHHAENGRDVTRASADR